MENTLTSNQISGVIGSLIGLAVVASSLVFGPVEMWSIALMSIGILLIVTSVVVFVSGSSPREGDLHHRGGGV
ncbi:hypothetical protein AArcCO_0647 [Halalkaliarchaeum sp. AArc-CO]|uniref:hypothetical protein n=1 Tax=Halalkaliarchaeum sp. AArc-GB TaxID=3074078 RepID=UPI0028603BB5|nr:hypothetical protein [Halalkaliarchaeum sp. AArc-GB]MDR5672401.1 hypothetical protein [Halalkaliarchaeum sp. AArc-GB]UWG49969.1 hypothetical protein AArcCO_0647 [Halalkaliarchaeum sp. AArc-CO]